MLINVLNRLSIVIAPIFYKLLYMSIAALVIGVIILLVRKVADKRISPFWKSMMWLLVLFALVVPYRPQSNLALLNNVEQVQEVSFREEDDQTIKADYKNLTEELLTQAIWIAQEYKFNYKSLIFDFSLPLVWSLGVVLLALFMLAANIRLKMKIKQNIADVNMDRYGNLLQKCKKQLGITRNFEIFVQDYIGTPALMGIKPKIILPVYIEEMEDQNVEYILLHELTHYKRGDMILNYILIVLQTIYWFNPLTWMLFKFIRQDMELANDGAVLRTIGNEKQKEYSMSLIAVLAKYSKVSFVPKLLCMVDNKDNMERRIKMIKLGEVFKKKKVIISLVSLVIIGVVGMLFLTSGSGDKIPPLYASAENNKTVQAIRGSYHWEFGTIIKTNEIADALMPAQMDYEDENTLTLEAGQQIVISNQKSNKDKRYEHSSNVISIYTAGGAKYGLGLENYENVDGDYYLNVPNEIGEYIYEIEIEYERGTVTYGFKIVVVDVLVSSLAQDLYDNKNPYIGNAGADGKILQLLNIADEIGRFTIELQTSNEPYSIKLNFKDKVIDRADIDLAMQYYSYIILALIDNASEVHWSYPFDIDGEETLVTASVRASDIQAIIGHDVKEFGKSAEKLQMLLERQAKPQLTLEDVIRLSSKGEELSWKDFEPYDGRATGSGLYIMLYMIDPQYSVWVGGSWPTEEKQPIYISLSFVGEDGRKDSMNLWKDDVEQFIHKHKADAATIIEDNLEIIMSSPKVSSNPLDYINEHKDEFDAIVYFDTTALFEFYSKFEKGGQTGLEGQIMEAACREILASEGIQAKGDNGQEWYDAYKEYVIKLRDEKSVEFIQQNYPKAYKLLKMLGETGEIGGDNISGELNLLTNEIGNTIENTTEIVIGFGSNSYIAIITDEEEIKQIEGLFNGTEVVKSDTAVEESYLRVVFSGEERSNSFYIDSKGVIKLGDDKYVKSNKMIYRKLKSIFNDYSLNKK